MDKFLNDLKNKKIAILGFGREGKSTYNLIRKYLKEEKIDIIDENEKVTQNIDIDENIRFIIKKEYTKLLQNYDIIFKSPGISFKGIDTSKFEKKITSQLEVLLKYFKNYTKIGITGTKGKSTTSSLIYSILKDQGKKVDLIGNIGVPIFDDIERLKDMDYVVVEMSSHQLQYVDNSPNIAVILNIYEEHLDHYNSYEEYIMSKLNIAKFQESSDYYIYNPYSEILQEHTKKTDIKSNIIKISEDKNYQFDFKRKRKLLGKHNETNIKFAIEVSKILKLDMEKVYQTIYEFKPLEHRLEYVGKYNDVFYYNDSIATIPEATISCIEALKNVNTLLIGGLDRGIDYKKLIDYLNNSNVENIICMYSVGEKLYKKLDSKKAILAKDLYEAIEIAKKVTKKGKICVLSPAAASYGFFKNFEERGNVFKEYVKK